MVSGWCTIAHYSVFTIMKSATVHEIKQALKNRETTELIDLTLRLARFKKENKELLTYLLFEADDPELYIRNVKEELDEAFSGVNKSNLYLAKKMVRKILRTANKYIRYTGSKTAEVEILLHYLHLFVSLKLPLHRSITLSKLYAGQIKKVEGTISELHEDLQFEYRRELEKLK